MPQLVSRLSHSNQEIGNLLMKIIGRVFSAYPRSTIWALLPPLESLNQKMNSRTKHILVNIKQNSKSMWSLRMSCNGNGNNNNNNTIIEYTSN